MVSPAQTDRGFFNACVKARIDRQEEWLRRWADATGPLETILDAEFLEEDRRQELKPFFRAHLLCAGGSRAEFWPATGTVSEAALARIHAETKLPLNYLRDLAAEICGRSRLAGIEPEASVMVLLVDAKDQGHTATLVMEQVSPGEGHIYPAPAISLISRDQDFRNGEEAARRYVEERLGLRDPNRDIRWSLRMRRDTSFAARDSRAIRLGGPGPAPGSSQGQQPSLEPMRRNRRREYVPPRVMREQRCRSFQC